MPTIEEYMQQDLFPWKETGYGGGMTGIKAWQGAGSPLPNVPNYGSFGQPAPTAPAAPAKVSPANTAEYWMQQDQFPWKEMGYGGGMTGIEAWRGANRPLPGGYPSFGPTPTYTPLPGAAYGTPDYWMQQDRFPWKEMGYGGGIVGIRAWEAAGKPLPPSYPGGGGVDPLDLPPGPTWPSPVLPSDFPPDYPPPGSVSPYAAPEPSFPPEWAGTLEKFGYTDPMGMNVWEQEGLKFIEDIYGTKLPLETMAPATDVYERIIRGEFAPDISGLTEPASMLYRGLAAGEQVPDISAQIAPAEELYRGLATGEFAPDVGGLRAPAEELYRSLLGGEYGPEGETYRRDVYEATKTGAMQSLEDMQQQMAESFAQRGGYFGGRHAMAQSMLGERVGTSLNEILANLNLTGYQQNLANMLTAGTGMRGLAGETLAEKQQDVSSRIMGGQGLTDLTQLGLQAKQLGLEGQLMGGQGLLNVGQLGLGALGQDIASRTGAAGGLTGVAGQQQAVTDAILGNLLTGGQMISQREMVNRSELQNAMQRAYQDWIRARQETMMPFQMGMGLLGFQPQQPIVQQPQPSPWGQLLGGIGTGAGAAGSSALFKLLGLG